MTFESGSRIILDTMRVMLRIGHFAWEREEGRLWPVDITVELFTSRTRWPAPTLQTIIDYNRVHAYIQSWATGPHRAFLESYAEDLLDFCFADPGVDACRVRLIKPDIYANAAGAGVEIGRTRTAHEAVEG